MYPYVNTDPSSAHYGQDYYVETATHGEEAHVYADGYKDYVPDSFNNVAAGSWSPPSTPTVGSTGGTAAPAPVAPAPAPAPAPAAPTPSAPAAPATSNVPPAITAEIQQIGEEIKGISSSQLPPLQAANTINGQIDKLQLEISSAYSSGAINQDQMQGLENQTVELNISSIKEEMNALEQQGAVSTEDQQALQNQYDILRKNISSLESRGAITANGGNLQGTLTSLESQINALATSGSVPSGGTTPPTTPIGSSGGGGSSSGGSSGNNPSNSGSPGSGSFSSGGATGTTDGDDSTPSQLGSVAPAASTGSSSSGGAASASGGGATYTVVHGDTMWGIAHANGISLSQLEALNPQISNPRLIVPGETVNLGSGGTGDSSGGSSASGSGSTYTVIHGDTLSGIAAAHGMTTSQIEALNPQFKDPDLIFPGQSVNLGGSGGGTTTSTDPTQAVVSQTQTTSPSSSTGASTDSNSDNANSGITPGSGGDSGAITIGFPEKSSYPFGTIGSEAEKALSGIAPNTQAAGWVSGAESESTDIAKQVFEAADDSHSSTDPLKINDVKDQSSSH